MERMMRYKIRVAPYGFTLVELLVVITIISLLAMLLLPVLESARCSTRSVVCLSNLKQVGHWGQFEYAEDWNGILPHQGSNLGTYPELSTDFWYKKSPAYRYTNLYVPTGSLLHCRPGVKGRPVVPFAG